MFIDIQTAGKYRTDLKMDVINDHIVYAASLDKRDGVVEGITYAKFDFDAKSIKRINTYEISDAVKTNIVNKRKEQKMLGDDDFKNYGIADFHVNEGGKVTLILEKRFVTSVGREYDPDEPNLHKNWELRPGTVVTESLIIPHSKATS